MMGGGGELPNTNELPPTNERRGQGVGSESDCQIRMLYAICQTVTGSGDTVGAVLITGTDHHCLKVSDHHATHTSDAGDGHPLASTNGVRRTASGQVSITNGTNGSATTVLSVTGQGLTLTGTTAGQAGDGEIHQVGCG